MLADAIDVPDFQSGGNELLIDVNEIAFVKPRRERLLDTCGSSAGDEEEDLLARIDEVEQLSAGFEAGGGDTRMTAFNNLRALYRPSIAGGDGDEGVDIIIEPIAQRTRALADGDDGARHVGRGVNEALGRAGVESAEVDGFELIAQWAIVAPTALRSAYFTERL
jgi:sirohydrochlorin ferrochelatase